MNELMTNGQRIEPEDLLQKGKSHGILLPDCYLRLLAECGNGGKLLNPISFYVPRLNDGGTIQSLLGIDVDDPVYDVAWSISLPYNILLSSRYIPFATDDGDGFLWIKLAENEHSIWYRPWDMIDDSEADSMFLVAPDMASFLASLMSESELMEQIGDSGANF